MLEENAWRERNGLDDLTWNPDAVAPPLGDVYQREAKVSEELKAWALVALAAAMVLTALTVLKL